MSNQDGKTIVIVCPEFAWLQIEETLQTDMQPANFDKETQEAIAKAYETLTVIEGPNAQPLFGFRAHTAIVKDWVSMCRLWGHLTANDGLLVAAVPLPDNGYQIFVQEERATMLDEALKAIDANSQGARIEPVQMCTLKKNTRIGFPVPANNPPPRKERRDTMTRLTVRQSVAFPIVAILRKGGPKVKRDGKEMLGPDLNDRFRVDWLPGVDPAIKGLFVALYKTDQPHALRAMDRLPECMAGVVHNQRGVLGHLALRPGRQ